MYLSLQRFYYLAFSRRFYRPPGSDVPFLQRFHPTFSSGVLALLAPAPPSGSQSATSSTNHSRNSSSLPPGDAPPLPPSLHPDRSKQNATEPFAHEHTHAHATGTHITRVRLNHTRLPPQGGPCEGGFTVVRLEAPSAAKRKRKLCRCCVEFTYNFICSLHIV